MAQIEGGKPADAVAWIDKFLEDYRNGYYEDETGNYIGEWGDEWKDQARFSAPGVKFVEELSLPYDRLMSAAENYLKSGDYCCLPFETPESGQDKHTMERFWKQYEAITGVTPQRGPWFFHCAC